MGQVKLKGTMRVKTYAVVEEAVSNGLRLGMARAHKHTDTPDQATVIDKQLDAIMTELDDVVRFD